MPLVLHLGVVDVAYSDPDEKGVTTTGQVAEILESRYHVMETFFQLRKEKIAGVLADDMAQSLETMIKAGVPIRSTATLTFGADQKIETLFRQFLDIDEMTRLFRGFTGSPLSMAADRGVSHRRKQPYKKRPARPAFVDTGLYRISMRAWTSSRVEAKALV